MHRPSPTAIRLQVAQDVFAGADGGVKIPFLLEMIVGIEKCVTNQRSPHYGRHALGQIERPRLIVEVIAPARPAIAGGLVVGQPLEGELSLALPVRVARGFVQTQKPRARNPMPLLESSLKCPAPASG